MIARDPVTGADVAGHPAADPSSLDDRELGAWRGFLRVHRHVVARLDAELIAAHALPLTSYEVLMFLLDAPGRRIRMSEIADRLLLSRSGLTRLIDRLEQQGLVRREPCADDARGMFAVLTEPGREKVEAARRTHLAGVREHFLSRLDTEHQDALTRAWRLIELGAPPQT